MIDYVCHPELLDADRSLLLVVDMQRSLLKAISSAERLISAAQLLIQGAHILHVPIIATTQNAAKLGPITDDLASILPPHLHPVDKMTFSCPASPGFRAELEQTGRSQIVLCGVEAHICVCQTALDLLEMGYQVHAVADAICARSEANYRIGLERMRVSGIRISSVEMALYEWLRQAGTPEFREILKMVK